MTSAEESAESKVYEVESILGLKVDISDQHAPPSWSYLVKWMDYGHQQNSWEPESGLLNCTTAVTHFHNLLEGRFKKMLFMGQQHRRKTRNAKKEKCGRDSENNCLNLVKEKKITTSKAKKQKLIKKNVSTGNAKMNQNLRELNPQPAVPVSKGQQQSLRVSLKRQQSRSESVHLHENDQCDELEDRS